MRSRSTMSPFTTTSTPGLNFYSSYVSPRGEDSGIVDYDDSESQYCLKKSREALKEIGVDLGPWITLVFTALCNANLRS